MPFVEDVEDARQHIASLNMDRIGENIDAENVQDNEDCALIEDEIHPDFETRHPDYFDQSNPKPSSTTSGFRKVDLWDSNEMRVQIRKLDADQRYVLDQFVKYGRSLKMAEQGFCQFPSPPLYVIEGDAGSGKSTLIEILCQIMEKEFRKAGDDPDQPYILKGSFTGEAACNIKGQTLNSMFNLGFGNKLTALGDMIRENKREVLQNVKLVIIDESSMVKSDMLYQIDQRLKEIMIRPDVVFGNVSVILLGNLLQLPPVKGKQIFEEPASDQWKFGHQLNSLWEMFIPIMLTYNHRQAEEGQFAQMLKRLARGIKTSEDLDLLRTRVVKRGDSQIPENTTYVFPLRSQVNQCNEFKLNEMNDTLEVLAAINVLSTKKTFEPYVDPKDGKVRNTPLQNILYLKKGAKIILIHNIDVCDGLNNGAKGVVMDFIRTEEKVTHVVVEFRNR